MFLYNMLNDKHTELTGLATDLQKIAANVKSIQEGMAKKKAAEPAPVPKPEPAAKKVETKEQEVPVLKKEEEPETEENHTGRILEMRKKGMQSVEIAKALGVGLGEVNLVLGLAIFISANIFNASPAIHSIVMSGYTQRRNKAGEVNDEYVYSIKFLREIFENSVLANVNPMDFCMRFENRSNITSTMLMKKIQPYEMGE